MTPKFVPAPARQFTPAPPVPVTVPESVGRVGGTRVVVGVAVGEGVVVRDGSGAVAVAVGVGDGLGEDVLVGVGETVTDGVALGTSVSVGVGGMVGAGVSVAVEVAEGEGDAVTVAVAVAVNVAVTVGVGASQVTVRQGLVTAGLSGATARYEIDLGSVEEMALPLPFRCGPSQVSAIQYQRSASVGYPMETVVPVTTVTDAGWPLRVNTGGIATVGVHVGGTVGGEVGVSVIVGVKLGIVVGDGVGASVAVGSVVAVDVGDGVSVAVGVESIQVTVRHALPTSGLATSRARTERTTGTNRTTEVSAANTSPSPVQSSDCQTVRNASNVVSR